MDKIKVITGVILALSIACTSCNNSSVQQLKSEHKMEPKTLATALPAADQWVNSPLRNRLKLKLNATVEAVWALVGDPANMPQYSEGLRKVDAEFDANENCTGYTCFFKPVEGQEKGIEHFAAIVWHEKYKGWASTDGADNPFGVSESLALLTIQPENENTILVWDFHFNCENEEALNFNKDNYQKALDDISQRLVKRFGGTQLENYVEGL